jgi:hypothetical protein
VRRLLIASLPTLLLADESRLIYAPLDDTRLLCTFLALVLPAALPELVALLREGSQFRVLVLGGYCELEGTCPLPFAEARVRARALHAWISAHDHYFATTLDLTPQPEEVPHV